MIKSNSALCAIAFLMYASLAHAQSEPVGVCVQSQPGGCGTQPSTSPVTNVTPAYDNSANVRARELAAERVRRAEADRVETARLAAEKTRKAAEFIRARNATILKGSVGSTIKLRGGGTASTELRELHGSATNVDKPQGAWKQLHCAAAIVSYGLEAAGKDNPDYQESSFLLAQAANALNGQALQVECPATPPFPDMHGHAVDMENVKQSEVKIISRAAVIVERMRTRALTNPAVTQVAPAVESAADKARRVQRELNEANSRKLSGTQLEIDQQRADTKALTKLILANAKLEKGQLESVVIGEDDSPRRPVPRPKKK